ncbi:hypothetical protein, partial [Sphaerochaeta sp. UBA5836]|uniref:hypothetical protein n=1 Tax=Sphaerochaeta sp. UBA5836 TaxID=1947474 RepID=UPI0025D5B7A1
DVDEMQHLLCWLLDCNLEVPAFKVVVFFLGSLEPFGMEELPFSQDGSSDNGWMVTVIGAFAETWIVPCEGREKCVYFSCYAALKIPAKLAEKRVKYSDLFLPW